MLTFTQAPTKTSSDQLLAKGSTMQPSKVRRKCIHYWDYQIVAYSAQKRKSALEETPPSFRRHTRGMNTDAARKAVLNTTELLESILVFLPAKTLFGVQRVSKQFQAIIARSIPVQEKMFLRVRNKPQPTWQLKGRSREPVSRAYFVEFPNGCEPPRHEFLYTPVELNPLLKLDDRRSKGWSCATRADKIIDEEVYLTFDQPLSLSKLDNAPPSILNTYISDPPVNWIDVRGYYELREGLITIMNCSSEESRSTATLGELLSGALIGDGRALIDFGSGVRYEKERESLGWEQDFDGPVLDPRRVLAYYETMASQGDMSTQGFCEVFFNMEGAVMATEAERAVVKPDGVTG